MRLRQLLAPGSASDLSLAFLVLMLLAVAASINVADSSVGKVSLLVAIPFLSILAVAVGIVRFRPKRPALWYLGVVAQVIGAVGAAVWHTKFASLDAPPMPGGSQDLFFV